MMMRITLKQIESFLAVADAGNFTRAAGRLNVPQPALSHAVKELESEIGLRLFDRTTRRVELTDAGYAFRESAEKILEELRLAVDHVHDLAHSRRGRIRVAAPPLLAAAVLPRAIADFRQRFPGIDIEVLDAVTEQIVDGVRAGRVDCGLGTFQAGEEGIERLVVMRDKLMLFCTPHALKDAVTIEWKQLEDLPIITLTRDSGIRLLVEVGFESAQVPLKPAFEVRHITTALAMVEAGLGFAALPTYALAATRGLAIVGRPLTEPEIAREVALIHPSGRSTTPALSSFVATVRRFARNLVPDVPDVPDAQL